MKKNKLPNKIAPTITLENGGALQLIQSLLSMAGPMGSVAGAGLGMFAGGNEDQVNQFEPQKIIKSPNPYINAENIAPMENGGSLNKYVGPTHEQGGMNIGGVEVEGGGYGVAGENEYAGIVNSDNITINQDMVDTYGMENGGRVPITSKDIGKTPAEVGNRISKKYEKFYDYDPFVVSETEHLTALSQMSDDLANEMDTEGMPIMEDGGPIESGTSKGRFKFSNIPPGEEWLEVMQKREYENYAAGSPRDFIGFNRRSINKNMTPGLSFDEYKKFNDTINPYRAKFPRGAVFTGLVPHLGAIAASKKYGNSLKPEESNDTIPEFKKGGSLKGRIVSPRQKEYFDYSIPKAEDGFNLKKLLGYASPISNTLQGISNANRPDEDINYPGIESGEYEPLDPTQAIGKAAEGFDNAQEGLRRSGSLTQAGAIQLATEREKATTNIANQFGEANKQGRNRFQFIKQRGDMFNATQKTREEIDRSANVGANLSRGSAFMSGVAENLGQIGRDYELDEAQEKMFGMKSSLLEKMYPHLFGKKKLTPEEEVTAEFDIY